MTNKRQKSPPIPLPESVDVDGGISLQHERLIGRIIAAWAALEDTMQSLLWAILEIPLEDGRVLTARTDATRKLQWIKAFAPRHYSGEVLAELTMILGSIQEAQDDRNFIAHATWEIVRPEGVPLGFSVRAAAPAGEIICEPFPVQRMYEIFGRIRAAKRALVIWKETQQASRETPSEPPPTNS